MKKIITLGIVALLSTLSLNAQNWVSTTPENKKVVLEEFTGLKCTYCPDGHKRANNLKEANKGKVFLINIHSGGYATPGAGEPDMRTPEGDVIDNASGLTGYPSGSVNRFKNPRAESRANWSASANTILSQSSPVNTYVKAYFDRTTRELTTEVEVYYTADGTPNNKLTVMLTQDGILGPQTGGTQFYPENYIGDQYVHNHVLRDVLSPGGAWGETLAETNSGSYIYKKYVTVLPETIKNVPLVFYNLSVVAFVSESDNNNILTGAEAKVDFDPTGAVDLSLVNKSSPTGLCVDPFKPTVEVSNPSTETVTSFDLTASINGVSSTKSFSGSIAPGGKTTIEFDQLITPRGEYSVSVNGFKNINGGELFDTDQSNDAAQVSGIGFQKDAFSYYKIGFNSGIDANTGRWIKLNPGYLPVNQYGHTGGAILYYLDGRAVANQPGEIVAGQVNFSSITDPIVSFYYAYSDGEKGGTVPKFEVKVSDDCGSTFTSIKTITCQETGQPVPGSNQIYLPTSGEYKLVTIDLAAYAGKKVLISIAGVPGTNGSALWLDEIEIGSASKIASLDDVQIEGLNIYPNPVNDVLNVSIENKENARASLINLQGIVVTEFDVLNGIASIDISNISEGLYIMNIKSGNATSSVKVNIKH